MTEKQINDLVNSIRQRISAGSEGLTFDPIPHEYYFNNVKMTPVSHVCEIFENPFDEIGNATRVARKEGVPVNVILERWKANSEKACTEGTYAHAYGELNFYRTAGQDIPSDATDVLEINETIQNGTFVPGPKEKAVEAVWRWLKEENPNYRLIPVAAENKIINPKLKYAGTFDLLYLLIKPNGTYGLIIFDYKTNWNLFNIFKPFKSDTLDTMQGPFGGVPDCAIGHYMVQQSLYQLGLERVIPDVPILARILLWIEPEGVDLIDKNCRYSYLLGSNKWPKSAWLCKEIDDVKKKFQFKKMGEFAMVRLPDVSKVLDSYLTKYISVHGAPVKK